MNLPSSVKEFAKRSAGITIVLLIDFYSGYNQVKLHPESHNMTVFQTSLGLLQQTRLSQEATNSVNQFWQIVCQILERNHDDREAYFDDV